MIIMKVLLRFWDVRTPQTDSIDATRKVNLGVCGVWDAFMKRYNLKWLIQRFAKQCWQHRAKGYT